MNVRILWQSIQAGRIKISVFTESPSKFEINHRFVLVSYSGHYMRYWVDEIVTSGDSTQAIIIYGKMHPFTHNDMGKEINEQLRTMGVVPR